MKWLIFMALNLVSQFHIHPSLSLGLSAPYSNNRTVKTYWNDSTSAFEVKIYDTAGTLLASPTTGPTIVLNPYSRLLQLYTKYYKYCSGTTLYEFHPNNTGTLGFGVGFHPSSGEYTGGGNVRLAFPYATYQTTANHWSCDVHVCDIEFDLTYTTVTEDSGASDGTVEVKAISSGGTVKFSRDPNATYASATAPDSYLGGGAWLYTFTDLPAGTYTLYAIDYQGCKASLIVNVPSVAAVYGVRWRYEHNDLQGRKLRVDIEEKDYAGAVTQVIGSSSEPFQLPWNSLGEVNIFTPVIASVVSLELISETDFMFLDLFTQDERKYRVKQYKNTGSGLELKWTGYGLPMAYSEPYYTDRNYGVTFTANDQLGNLKDLPFTDDSGNVLVGSISFLDAICTILRKTDIDVDVRESVNIFETTMDQDPEDSALQQAFFDATIYTDKNCEEVLISMLQNWGARLYQAEGYWHVELIEQRGSASIAYRQFDINGQYQSNGTLSPVSNIKRATESDRSVLRDRSGLITIIPSYGKLLFTVKTNFVNNLLTRGTFERVDVQNNQIIGWTFDMTNATGVSYGIEDITPARGDSKSALFIDFSNVDTAKTIILIPESFYLAEINGPSLTFKFDVLFRPYYKEIFSYIDFSIKIGDLYAGPINIPSTGSADELLDGEYFRVYVDSALEWKTITQPIRSTLRQLNVELVGPVVIKIRVNNNVAVDYASITALRAQSTDEDYVRHQLTRVKVQDGTLLRLYTLNSGTDADDSPDVIRPDDYHGTTNARVWKLDKTLELPDEDYLLAGLLIDNVVLSIENEYAEEDVLLEKVIDENIKPVLELDLLHCDLVISELAATVASDDNMLRLSRSFIRKNDGTQTVLWKRTYEDEERTLIDIVMKMYQAQVTLPSFKLTGSFYTDVYPSLFNSFYESRMDKYFLPVALTIRDQGSSFDAELIELRTGADGEPPAPETYEYTDEHSTEFDA